MIIPKKTIDLFLSNSEYLKTDFQTMNKLVGRRLYNFAKDGEQIEIQRMSKDIYDLSGGELYKLCPIAKGKISQQKGGIQLDLKVGLLPLFKWALIFIFVMFGITIYLAFGHSLQAGKTIIVLSALICLIPYLLLYRGVANFKHDLISDFKNLDSETENQ